MSSAPPSPGPPKATVGTAARTTGGPREHAATPEPRPSRLRPSPSSSTGRIPPSSAAIARPMLVLLPVVTFLVPGVLLALVRTPVHTAEARMLVGGFNVQAQAVPGFVEAAQTLAETYSRLVETELIIERVAEELDLAPSAVAGHISATSVPESAIIRVEGAASNEQAAVAFAQAAAEALEDYASGEGQGGDQLLDEYEQAMLELRAAEREQQRLLATTADDPSAASQELLAQADAATQRARLRADSLGARYTNSGAAAGGVDLVGSASPTGSDRRSRLMFAVAASIVLGLIAGMALVTIVVNREVVRRTGGRATRA